MRNPLQREVHIKKHYPYSNYYFEQYIKRLNSKNITTIAVTNKRRMIMLIHIINFWIDRT
jgi:hypothetical protein